VSPSLAQEVAGRYCHSGTPVLFEPIPGAEIFQGTPRAFNDLADRIAGIPAPSNCRGSAKNTAPASK
jgi:hypothetical protein